MADNEFDDAYKRTLTDAYERAIEDGYKQIKIAEHTGIPDESLKGFARNGSLGRDHCLRLEKWLKTVKRFWPESKIWETVARDLRGVADILDGSDMSEEFKKSRVKTLVKVLIDANAEHTRIANERTKSLE